MTAENTKGKEERKIKFRAWDKEKGRYANFANDSHIVLMQNGDIRRQDGFGSSSYIRQDDMVIEQFTGLLDKNGREIYEGDIVSMFGDSQRSAVFWDEVAAGWSVTAQVSGYSKIQDEFLSSLIRVCVVIGNIHENPNLLK